MATKHTPLPWSQCGLNVIGADRTVVCTVNRPPGDNTADAFRNLDLLAAAPELLAAAKEAIDWMRECEGGTEQADDLRAAIAKAEGRTP